MYFEIEKNIYDRMLGVVPVPPETGGIIGGRNMRISMIVVEEPRGDYTYTPDVSFLNSIIAQWGEQGISFYGIFHSHSYQASSLSKADGRYIETIMKAMPETVNALLFPLVLPGRKIIPYLAKRVGSEVVIEESEFVLVEQETSFRTGVCNHGKERTEQD